MYGKLKKNEPIVFEYSGQGSQWYGMGQRLMESNSIFRKTIEEIDEEFENVGYFRDENSSLIDEMTRQRKDSKSLLFKMAQPILFASQIALTKLYESMGIRPDAVIGHSNGDAAACVTAGVFTIKEIVLMMYARSIAFKPLENSSVLLSVKETLDVVKKKIDESGLKLDIAVINTHRTVTVSGNVEDINIFQDKLIEENVPNKILKVYLPLHSYRMDEVKDKYIEIAGDMKGRKSSIPIYLSTLGKKVSGNEINTCYWFDDLRKPVLFYDTVLKVFDDGYKNFLEVSPHSQHIPYINEIIEYHNLEGNTISSLMMFKDEVACFQESIDSLIEKEIFSV